MNTFIEALPKTEDPKELQDKKPANDDMTENKTDVTVTGDTKDDEKNVVRDTDKPGGLMHDLNKFKK